jgi:hypothetical protein
MNLLDHGAEEGFAQVNWLTSIERVHAVNWLTSIERVVLED